MRDVIQFIILTVYTLVGYHVGKIVGREQSENKEEIEREIKRILQEK